MISICSLKGAPGVTTLAYAFASVLVSDCGRDSIVAECDPNGGDIAARLGISVTPGLATLASTARRGLRTGDVRNHVQRSGTGPGVIAGLLSADQSPALGPLWEPIAIALDELEDCDVIVDLGRIEAGMEARRFFLMRSAMTVVVCQPTTASLVLAAQRLDALHSVAPNTAIVLSGPGPHRAEEVSESFGVQVLGEVAWDQPAFDALFESRSSRFIGHGSQRDGAVRDRRRRSGKFREQVCDAVDVLGRMGAFARRRHPDSVNGRAPGSSTVSDGESRSGGPDRNGRGPSLRAPEDRFDGAPLPHGLRTVSTLGAPRGARESAAR